MLNQYGNAKINGWDGNAVDIDNEGGVILAPQVGAGRKEPDNTFTGVIIGEAKQNDSGMSKTYNGVLGFSKGRRSIYLDAQTGRAYFGVTGQGQIELIPDGDSTIGGWIIGQKSLHSKGKDHFGPLGDINAPVGAYLDRDGLMDFTSSSGNYLRYNGIDFYLNGGTITGGSIDIGDSFFTADSERIDFGSFVITQSYGRDAFTVDNHAMAVSAKPGKTGGWWMWFSIDGERVGDQDQDDEDYEDQEDEDEEYLEDGEIEDDEDEDSSSKKSSSGIDWNDPSNYAMVLNSSGQLYAQDFLYIDRGPISVKDQIHQLWDQIQALWAAMDDDEEED